MFGELVAILILLLIVVGLGFAGWRWFGSRRSAAPAREPNPAPAAAPVDRLGPFGKALQGDAVAGRQDAVLRRLDRELPEWPASSTLIEAVRELFALQSDLKVARTAEVPDTITDRLAEEIDDTADLLWRRADRLALAGRVSTPRLSEDMERQDEQLMRLHESIREARAGLSELTLAGAETPLSLDRSARKFQALANTARELQDLDRERMP